MEEGRGRVVDGLSVGRGGGREAGDFGDPGAPAAARRDHPRARLGALVSKKSKIGNFFAKFCKFLARSRLYQNEIWQENMRSTAFFKLYRICILLHRCNLKSFAKNRFEKKQQFS